MLVRKNGRAADARDCRPPAPQSSTKRAFNGTIANVESARCVTRRIDDELVCALQTGDRTKVDVSFRRILAFLYALMSSRRIRPSGPCEDADDLVQRVCLVILRAMPRSRWGAAPQFLGWLRVVLLRTVRDLRRADERMARWHRETPQLAGRGDAWAARGPMPANPLDLVPDLSPTPIEQIARRELVSIIQEACLQLPPRQLEVLLAVGVGGMSAREAGRRLRLDKRTILRDLGRARAAILAERLGGAT